MGQGAGKRVAGDRRRELGRPVRAPAGSPSEELLERIVQALESGLISEDDVARLLDRDRSRPSGRPTAASVLYALGSVVVFGGIAIAYGTIFADLPWRAQMTTPFLFPLAAFGIGIWLARHRLPTWQTDVAELVGCVALTASFVIAGVTSGWVNTGREASGFVAAASILGASAVVAQHRVTRSFHLIALGLPAALAALGVSTAYLIGLVGSETICWAILAEAAVAAVIAPVFAHRDRRAFLYALIWATLGAYAAVYAAVTANGLSHFTVWHVILAAVMTAAFVTAGAFDLDGLIWIGAVGGAAWMVMIAVIVGSATSAALAVVLAGIGLVGLGLLVTRLRRASVRQG